MNYSRYKRPLSNPVNIVITDKMKKDMEETDKYWERIEPKLNEI